MQESGRDASQACVDMLVTFADSDEACSLRAEAASWMAGSDKAGSLTIDSRLGTTRWLVPMYLQLVRRSAASLTAHSMSMYAK